MQALNVSHDIDASIARLTQWMGHIPTATALALNDTGFAVRKAEQDLMGTTFDRVTPFLQRSVLVDQATPDHLTATVAPEYLGGKGGDPASVLRPHIFGGRRDDKAAERMLQRAGILPGGYQIVPGAGAPLDPYGNIQRGFIVKILAWFESFGMAGYSANMTAATRGRRMRMGRSEGGYRMIRGVGYFVAYGQLRDGRGSHLAPGIYSKTGIHGVDIQPVLMFVQRGTYAPRLAWFETGRAVVGETFPRRFRYRYRSAVEALA